MSFATEMLAKIEAVLSGKADNDVKTFQYNGKMLSKYSFTELMDIRDRLKREVEAEKREEAMNNGLGVKRFVKVRF